MPLEPACYRHETLMRNNTLKRLTSFGPRLTINGHGASRQQVPDVLRHQNDNTARVVRPLIAGKLNFQLSRAMVEIMTWLLTPGSPAIVVLTAYERPCEI